jgi:hypothetical protein
MYRAGSLVTVLKELSKYKLDSGSSGEIGRWYKYLVVATVRETNIE